MSHTQKKQNNKKSIYYNSSEDNYKSFAKVSKMEKNYSRKGKNKFNNNFSDDY
jgi:hypothetical protein